MPVSRRARSVWLALLGLFTALAMWIAVAQHAAFHPADMACEGCHLAGKSVKPDRAYLLISSQEKLCAGCHQRANQVSHPSGFPPRGKFPAEYPVDSKGDLTCSTCHDVHGKTPGILRGSRRGRELCLACHDTQFFERMRDQGTSLTASGHLDAGGPMTRSMLDPYSLQCMGCHASAGENPTVSVDRNSVVRHGTNSFNHSIMVSYADAMKFGGYRPQSQISKKILLPGGLVSCVSCHDGYSKNHGQLVMPMAKSALCFECHDL